MQRRQSGNPRRQPGTGSNMAAQIKTHGDVQAEAPAPATDCGTVDGPGRPTAEPEKATGPLSPP